jgi:chromosome condensin MukBEF ATPase and DNA-binding subunit MukB
VVTEVNRSTFFNVQLAARRIIPYITPMDASDRALETLAFERDTEMLAACQLDLLAQLERQLRAVHHAMQHIDKLRNFAHRAEPALTVEARHSMLTRVDEAIEALDSQLQVEHSCCSHMRDTIIKMQARVADLRRRAPVVDPAITAAPPPEPQL